MEHKRKCVSCGELKPLEQLIKITKEHKSGNIVIQPDSKTFGRSVYLCYNQECINTVLKKGINKPLKANISREDLKGLLDGQFKS
ncbi:YlxR family protein [bacterium]|nr:YlxR family protein [bacterium]